MLLLERERKGRGITQAELARLSGVNDSYISKAEKHGFAYPAHIRRIARALEFDGRPGDLLKEVE